MTTLSCLVRSGRPKGPRCCRSLQGWRPVLGPAASSPVNGMEPRIANARICPWRFTVLMCRPEPSSFLPSKLSRIPGNMHCPNKLRTRCVSESRALGSIFSTSYQQTCPYSGETLNPWKCMLVAGAKAPLAAFVTVTRSVSPCRARSADSVHVCYGTRLLCQFGQSKPYEQSGLDSIEGTVLRMVGRKGCRRDPSLVTDLDGIINVLSRL